MKQIVILSGKGGTGKTSVVAALAHLASQQCDIVLADADVDAANLELVLSPRNTRETAFVGAKEAVIDARLCTDCGRCAEVCRFDAVSKHDTWRVDPIACEGCAACYYQCPSEAIALRDRQAGLWYRSDTPYGPLYHAHLFAGQENSGKLVTMVKQQANMWAYDHGTDYVLVDGPPGIGCPVIAACAGSQLAVLVIEPTVSGVHDLERILATTQHFRVPAAAVVNKFDINPARSDEIDRFCQEEGIPLVGRIPYDTIVTEAMVQGQPVTIYDQGPVSLALSRIWQRVRDVVDD